MNMWTCKHEHSPKSGTPPPLRKQTECESEPDVLSQRCTEPRANTHTYTHTHTHTQTDACIHTSLQTCMHTDTHTQTHGSGSFTWAYSKTVRVHVYVRVY